MSFLRTTRTWSVFDKELKKYPDVLTFIDNNITAKEVAEHKLHKFRDKFQRCFYQESGLLKDWIIGSPHLAEAYSKYRTVVNEGSPVENFIVQHPQIIHEYAAFIGKQGQHLSADELHLTALALNYTIHLYTRSQDSQDRKYANTYNPQHGIKEFCILYNGRNHFEQIKYRKVNLVPAVERGKLLSW